MSTVSRAAQNTIGSRVGELVETFHSGSVNAAAKFVGIPQPTLRRIVVGLVQEPRASIVRRIAQAYNVSADWLLSGTGKGPTRLADQFDPGAVLASLRLLREVVRSLDLPTGIQSDVMSWAMMPLGVDVALSASVAVQKEVTLTASAKLAEAWAGYFTELSGILGADRLRDALTANHSLLHAGRPIELGQDVLLSIVPEEKASTPPVPVRGVGRMAPSPRPDDTEFHETRAIRNARKRKQGRKRA